MSETVPSVMHDIFIYIFHIKKNKNFIILFFCIENLMLVWYHALQTYLLSAKAFYISFEMFMSILSVRKKKYCGMIHWLW